MSLSNCPHCWDTPCTCADAHGYKHLSINELTEINQGIARLIEDKKQRQIAPGKREH